MVAYFLLYTERQNRDNPSQVNFNEKLDAASYLQYL